MNRLIAATVLAVTISAPAFAQTIPFPPAHPAVIHPPGYSQHFEFNKVMPNGHVRHCRVSQHLEQYRGLVRTQTCWRVR